MSTPGPGETTIGPAKVTARCCDSWLRTSSTMILVSLGASPLIVLYSISIAHSDKSFGFGNPSGRFLERLGFKSVPSGQHGPARPRKRSGV